MAWCEGILFRVNDGELDFDNPILSGFEYSRPMRDTVRPDGLDQKWDIYRWPSMQNEVPRVGRSKAGHDIYSLGLLLIDIAHWKQLHGLMALKRWPAPSQQDPRIRAWLLGNELFPPFKNNPLRKSDTTSSKYDAKYWGVTRRCLEPFDISGLLIAPSQGAVDCSQPAASELQSTLVTAFGIYVLRELDSIPNAPAATPATHS